MVQNKIISHKLLLMVSLYLVSFSIIMTRNLIDNEESIKKRLDWIKQHENEATGGKVAFEYSPENGVFCVNKEPSFKGEFVFTIKSDYITCSCKCHILCIF